MSLLSGSIDAFVSRLLQRRKREKKKHFRPSMGKRELETDSNWQRRKKGEKRAEGDSLTDSRRLLLSYKRTLLIRTSALHSQQLTTFFFGDKQQQKKRTESELEKKGHRLPIACQNSMRGFPRGAGSDWTAVARSGGRSRQLAGASVRSTCTFW